MAKTVGDLFDLERLISEKEGELTHHFAPIFYIDIEGMKTPGPSLNKQECEEHGFEYVPKKCAHHHKMKRLWRQKAKTGAINKANQSN